MKLYLSVTLAVLLSSSLISNDLTIAQTTTLQTPVAPAVQFNPFTFFTFDGQDVAEFLWNSLKVTYRSEIGKNLGNASAYLETMSTMAFGKNTTEQIFGNKVVQSLLNVAERELVDMFKNMDPRNATFDQILARLQAIDMSEFSKAAMTGVAYQIESMLPADGLKRLNLVLDRLENDTSVANEIAEGIITMGVPRTLPTWINQSIADLDDSLRQLVTKNLTQEPTWATAAKLEKLGMIMMNFDYAQYGHTFLNNLNSSLPLPVHQRLRGFLLTLESLNPVNIAGYIKQNLPVTSMYNQTRAMLMSQNITLPADLPFDLEFIGVYKSIGSQLLESLKVIMANNDIYQNVWMNSGVTDLERVGMILFSVDFSEIGEGIFGHMLDMIRQGTQLQSVLDQRISETLMEFIDMNDNSSSNSNITLISTPIAELMVTALNDTLTAESNNNANWTAYPNSEKLMKVLMMVDYTTLVRKSVVLFFQEGGDLVSTELQQNITEIVSMFNATRGFELKESLRDQLKKLDTQLGMTMPTWASPVREEFLDSVTGQLIDKFEDLLNNENSTITDMLVSANTTFSSLTDFEKFGFVMLAVDYTAIAQDVINKLDDVLEDRVKIFLNKLSSGSVVPDLEAAHNVIIQMLPISEGAKKMVMNMTAGCDVKTDLLQEINDQLKASYAVQSQTPTWKAANTTTLDKLMLVVENYNYEATGNMLSIKYLCVVDKNLPSKMSTILDRFITAVENRDSVVDILDDARKMLPGMMDTLKDLVKYVPSNWTSQLELMLDSFGNQMSSLASRDVLLPLYQTIDSHIQNLTQKEMDDWKAVNGRLEKVVRLVLAMDMNAMINTVTVTTQGMGRNILLNVVMSNLGQNTTKALEDFMAILESDGLVSFVNKTLDAMTGNQTMVKQLYSNDIVQSILKAFSDSLKKAYQQVRNDVGQKWRTMTASEKALRLWALVDMTKLMKDVSTSVEESTKYYMDILQPVYTQQCSWDLGNVTYGLMNIMNAKEEGDRWALNLVDSWGKLPSAIFRGAFTWPGDMAQCQKVKGNRVLNENGTITILEKGGIKGAWGMAYFGLPKSLSVAPGWPTPTLQLGYCLPESCDYMDSMSFLKRGNLLGLNLTFLKPRSEYPAFKEEYKTDSNFIGISAMFAVLIFTIAACSVVDRLVLKKREEQAEKQKEVNKMKYELTALPTYTESEKKNLEGAGSVMYNGADRAHANGGFEHDEKPKLNGDVESMPTQNGTAEHKPAPKSEAKPGLGIRLIKSFSLYETMPKLFESSPKPNQLQALDGIRFLSMTWVIYGHAFAFPFPYIKNPMGAAQFGSNGDWTFNAITGGLYAVDSFFLLSGLLVGYLFLKALDKVKGKIRCMTLVLYYVHRFLRLLPLYGGIILITIAYHRYIGTGPFNSWHSEQAPQNFCLTNWWANLLYINNFYKPTQMCNGVSWYLANDMQFYVISPLLLIPLYWAPKFGITLISALWATHIGLTGWEWSKRNGESQFTDRAIFQDIYIKPWVRIGPYLIGLLLAFVLFKKFKVKSGLVQGIWWLMSLGIIALAVYIPYDATKDGGVVSNSWDTVQRSTFETLNKSAWALALGWIIFACNTGCGGFIGDMLNWSGWAPFSRLTYAAYLIHPLIMEINYKNRHNLIYLNHLSLLYDNFSFLFISYFIGGILHLILEAPMLGLEKILLPRHR